MSESKEQTPEAIAAEHESALDSNEVLPPETDDETAGDELVSESQHRDEEPTVEAAEASPPEDASTDQENADTAQSPDSSPAESAAAAEPPQAEQPGVEESVIPEFTAGIDDRLDDMSTELNRKLARLHVLFEQKISREVHLDGIIDRLHADLQEHKEGLVLKIMEPMAKDFIGLHDDLGDLIARQQKKPADDPAAVAVSKEAADLRTDVEDILCRYGFEAFSVEGEEFDPTRQRIVRTEETTDPNLSGRIAQRRRSGFQYEGRLIRPEIVVAYKVKLAPSEPPTDDSGPGASADTSDAEDSQEVDGSEATQ